MSGWFVTSAGHRLRVSDRGTGPSTFVLVHGWKGSHRLWDRVVPLLAARHRVVSYDLRGMGESDKPSGPYDFSGHAADLHELLIGLDLHNVTLVGWSMGCTVSLEYADTIGQRVSRLVLHNGPLRLTRAADFPHAMTDSQFDGYLDELAATWPAGEHAFLAESLLPGSDRLLVDWMWQIALQTPLDVVLEIVRAQARIDHRAAVGRLRMPVLAAYSSRDPYYPLSLAEFIASNAPDGRLAVLEQSAHCSPIEEPVAFVEALEGFLAQT